MNYNNNRTHIFNVQTHSDITSVLEDHTYPISIFAENDNGTISYFSKIKLYSFKITREKSLIADFIPCYTVSDGTPIIGLYDVINNQFYTNQGEGAFVKGNDVIKN